MSIDFADEVRARMQRSQRHRLLHGYPMQPLLPRAKSAPEPAWFEASRDRPLLVGVLPHASCNPQVRGCGFCTFPHERFENARVANVVAHVAHQIEATVRREPSLRDRRIGGLYFGGGTANLTPPAAFARLAHTLTRTFDLEHAEITLEGVPKYFLIHEQRLLDVVAAMPARTRRISMGVQTFDPVWLAKMGRGAFGSRDEIAEAVSASHARGFTASGDFLLNLPGRASSGALGDIDEAIAAEFDQICIYHLVLAADFDAPWAHDRSLLARIADNDAAFAAWQEARHHLLAAGYVQTTLTNFELRPTFFYENASFDPATWDAVGFGPGAISTLTNPQMRTALKWIDEGQSDAFVRAIERNESAVAQRFEYDPHDLRIMHLTRNFARLAVDTEAHAAFFGSPPRHAFGAELAALEDAGLVVDQGATLALTERGMFFADAVAGTLAAGRVRTRKPPHGTMG